MRSLAHGARNYTNLGNRVAVGAVLREPLSAYTFPNYRKITVIYRHQSERLPLGKPVILLIAYALLSAAKIDGKSKGSRLTLARRTPFSQKVDDSSDALGALAVLRKI